MENDIFKPALCSLALGVVIGCAYVIGRHTGLEFLAEWLHPIGIPCYNVAILVAHFLPSTLEWVAWTAGAMTLGFIGSTLGAVVGLLMHRLRQSSGQQLRENSH